MKIPIEDCRGQGYDNAANMSGKFKGVQANIKEINPLAVYSNCGAHSLNLCGVNAAESSPDTITFFGTVQKLYNFLSHSPTRWEIVKDEIGVSLHSTSDTRWSARIQSVKPIATHTTGIRKALIKCKELNMTAEAQTELKGIMDYLGTFKFLILSAVWYKILALIDIRNRILQARNTTIDIEVDNINGLVNDLKAIRETFGDFVSQAKQMAAEMIEVDLTTEENVPEKRTKKRKLRFGESRDDCEPLNAENDFKINVFYVLIDSVISGLTQRFEMIYEINKKFSFLWKFADMNDKDLEASAKNLIKEYNKDINNLYDEILDIKNISKENFSKHLNLTPFEILNEIYKLKLENLFPNYIVGLRIFCTIPVSVAEAERSFSKLDLIKSVKRSTMLQDRLNSLAIIAIESDISKKIDFSDIITDFARKKARKADL